MKYKSLRVTRHGGPEVLHVVENDLHPPARGEVRIKVLAASVSRPDVTVRRGEALYSGMWLGQKLPFTPGYAVIDDVEAVGEKVRDVVVGARVGVLTVTGGYTEYLYWRADRLIPVPATLDPALAVPLILNYIVAYQTMHRVAKVRAGEKALIIGASGGIGTALLQFGQLAGLELYAIASQRKHAILTEYGATPIDYRTQDFVAVIRAALFGKVGAAWGIVLTVVIYLLLIPFSHWWMKRFLYGPAEWLWRSMTYWKLQPIRRHP
ncbi:MAG: DUF418 domain-containing protein [Caldilinea sp.]